MMVVRMLPRRGALVLQPATPARETIVDMYPLRLRLSCIVRKRSGTVFGVIFTLPEFGQTFAKTSRKAGQFFCPEKDREKDEDDDQLGGSEKGQRWIHGFGREAGWRELKVKWETLTGKGLKVPQAQSVAGDVSWNQEKAPVRSPPSANGTK